MEGMIPNSDAVASVQPSCYRWRKPLILRVFHAVPISLVRGDGLAESIPYDQRCPRGLVSARARYRNPGTDRESRINRVEYSGSEAISVVTNVGISPTTGVCPTVKRI